MPWDSFNEYGVSPIMTPYDKLLYVEFERENKYIGEGDWEVVLSYTDRYNIQYYIEGSVRGYPEEALLDEPVEWEPYIEASISHEEFDPVMFIENMIKIYPSIASRVYQLCLPAQKNDIEKIFKDKGIDPSLLTKGSTIINRLDI